MTGFKDIQISFLDFLLVSPWILVLCICDVGSVVFLKLPSKANYGTQCVVAKPWFDGFCKLQRLHGSRRFRCEYFVIFNSSWCCVSYCEFVSGPYGLDSGPTNSRLVCSDLFGALVVSLVMGNNFSQIH